MLCWLGTYAAGGHGVGAMLQGNLLSLSEIQFRAVCNQLSAVLHFDDRSDTFDLTQFGDNGRPFQRATSALTEQLTGHVRGGLGGSIYFYHKSFSDFLMDSTRSGTFCVMSLAMTNAHFKNDLGRLLEYDESYCFHEPELFLAPGVPGSAPSLSWPHTNGLVNSMLKACVYDWVSSSCFEFIRHPGVEPQLMRHFGRADFRKAQENMTVVFAEHSALLGSWSWGYRGKCKYIRGTCLFRTLLSTFQTFDVVGFNAMIKRFQKYGIIQPYHPNFTSRFKSLVPKKFQDKYISGLYRIGHGPKSCFWYWEINFEAGYYREFMSPDLAEGRRIYEEERFDLWDGEDA
ncbi:hypothetical protein P691DRAFT_766631 [Macrolepiota fuliginosa MF-IS2]|uniref:Uncharacterized protein n=1 Tax=Macrolepiota fuliginosa MF-IS2 TaxID=1400762 RepID=A0A9P5X1I2_9AGAR|nr:hypothetical protein P691DRAFT_766631 [Macrolepiota fuliginosa MF-IS2]